MLDASAICNYLGCMKTDQMTLRCEPEFKPTLDDIRRRESDLPSRTEMLHRLVSKAKEAIGDTETPAEAG